MVLRSRHTFFRPFSELRLFPRTWLLTRAYACVYDLLAVEIESMCLLVWEIRSASRSLGKTAD